MTVIHSNGSKWNGQTPDSLDRLFEVLATHPLDPAFEALGGFIGKAHGCRVVYVGGVRTYTDTGTMYPGIEATQFFGNFWDIAHVFNIDTDDADLIERLTVAIRANQASDAYAQAKTECFV